MTACPLCSSPTARSTASSSSRARPRNRRAPDAYMSRFPAPLDADGVAHAVLSIASGQEHPEATSLVVTGEGIEAI